MIARLYNLSVLNNNPDKPIIIGSIFNAPNTNIFKAEEAGIKFNTDERENSIVFNNKPNSEEILLNIIKDYKIHQKEGNYSYTLEKGNINIEQKEGNIDIISNKGNINFQQNDGNLDCNIKKIS